MDIRDEAMTCPYCGKSQKSQTNGSGASSAASDNTAGEAPQNKEEGSGHAQTGSAAPGSSDNAKAGADNAGGGRGDNAKAGADNAGGGRGDNAKAGADNAGGGRGDNAKAGADNAGGGRTAQSGSPHSNSTALRPVETEQAKKDKPKKTKEQKRKRWHHVKIFISILLLACIAITGYFVFESAGQRAATVDPARYFNVDVSGYNEYGEANVTFDEDAFTRQIAAKLDTSSIFRKISVGNKTDFAKELIDKGFSYSIGNTKDLANGDTVEVTFDIDNTIFKQYHVELADEPLEITVTGLKDVEKVDVFSTLNIRYTGVSPDGTISITGLDSTLKIKAEPSTGLANGDTVTLTLSPKSVSSFEKYMEKYKKIPEEESTTITVSGLSEYMTSIDQITDDAKNEIDAKAQSALQEEINSSWDSEQNYKSMITCGYILYSKDSSSAKPHNTLYGIYKVNVINGGSAIAYYYYVGFEDAVINSDGSCSVETDDFITPGSGSDTEGTYDADGHTYRGFATLDDLQNYLKESAGDGYTESSNVKNK